MTIRWLRCVLCGRPEDEATPSFSTYLHGVDSRCPECGKTQGVDPVDRAAVDRAAVESDLEDFDRLKDLILTLLPYALDDGEDPPTEANAEECVEYAADEIKRLRRALALIADTCVQDPDTAQFAARVLDGSADVGADVGEP